MKKARKFRPSPAMGVAMVALIVAIGGTAVAGGVLNKKKVNTIITNRAPGLSVASAKNADHATNADNAKNADNLGGLDPTTYKTASNYTQGSPGTVITNTLVTIGSPINVTTEGTRRLFASAAVHATTAAAAGNYFVCRITIDATNGATDTDFVAPTALTPVDAAVSPLASAVVGAGTHTVTLKCEALGGATPTMTVVDDALAAWAVAG
jgi:hypothetical protein